MTSPLWTPYAQEMALRYVLNLSPVSAPTSFYFALFTLSADPTLGVGTYESTDPGYSRAEIFWNSSGTTLFHMASGGSPGFTFTNAGNFSGIRIMDSAGIGTGHTLWWQDLDSTYEYDAGASVPLLAAAIMVGLSNPS